jgi:predicted RNase H-like HicB family nuclease
LKEFLREKFSERLLSGKHPLNLAPSLFIFCRDGKIRNIRSFKLLPRHSEGSYTVTCPSLPGLVTKGDTLEEARDMAADAIGGYLESRAQDKLPMPPATPGSMRHCCPKP